MLTLSGLIFLFLIAGIVFYWQRNRHIQEIATHIAREYCARKQWQFLDGTTQFKGLQFKKREKNWCLLREYYFEYYDGILRCVGRMVMHKTHLLEIRPLQHDTQPPSKNDQTLPKNNVVPFPKKKR